MPKVLRIINRLNLGGPTYNASYLSAHLAPEFETMLVAGMKDDSEASSQYITQKLGLEPVYVKDMYREINPLKDRKAYIEIKRLIREFKPDIVHTHAAKSGAIGRLAAVAEGVPLIFHTFHGHVFHSYFNALKTQAFLQIERYLAKKSTKIIAISSKQKEELCNDFSIAPSSKFEIIPLGFDLDRFQVDNNQRRIDFRKRYGLNDNDIAIGIIGRLVPIKNHAFFLEAFAMMKAKTNKSVKAIIIGDGEIRSEIETFAQEKGLSISSKSAAQADVLFTSWIKEIDTALPGLDIVALSSLNEGTPVSLIEAQAAGVPIVSTRVGGIEDIVLEDNTALLSSIDDVVLYSNQLLKLTEDNLMRTAFSRKGYTHVKDTFSYQRLVNDVKNLYNSHL